MGEDLFEDGVAVELCRRLLGMTFLDSLLIEIKGRQTRTEHITLRGGGGSQAFKNEETDKQFPVWSRYIASLVRDDKRPRPPPCSGVKWAEHKKFRMNDVL